MNQINYSHTGATDAGTFRKTFHSKCLTGLILFMALVATATSTQAEEFDPVAIFLTWQYDPTTTMTIDWHTVPEDGARHFIRNSEFQYKQLGSPEWREVTGMAHEFPHSDRLIHRIELVNLVPGTTYSFRFGEHSKTYRFRTMPADLSEPIRFAAGGDTGIDEDFRRMNRVVMAYDLDFIIWGGDITYANGDPARIYRWYDWFDGIKETLIDEDGKVTPIVLALGNHELFGVRRLVGSGFTDAEIEAYLEKHNLWDHKVTFFDRLFAFPGKPFYNVLDFGDYMSLIALDSDHYTDNRANRTEIVGTHAESPQTAWLGAVLAMRQDRQHIFPFYHVPAYPSHRSYDGSTSTRIRDNWVPLFEEYGVRLAFENHDHTYKRTHPIRNGEIVSDGEGIVFMGDGSWVAGPRDGNNRDAWYINEFASKNHGIIVTVHGESRQIIAVDIDGEEFDHYSIDP